MARKQLFLFQFLNEDGVFYGLNDVKIKLRKLNKLRQKHLFNTQQFYAILVYLPLHPIFFHCTASLHWISKIPLKRNGMATNPKKDFLKLSPPY